MHASRHGLALTLGRFAAGAVLAAAAMLSSAQTASAQSGGLIRDTEIEDTMRVWGEPIWRAADLNPRDIHVYIIEDSSLNAFVSGGQNIFFHTGLLLAARDPNEIVGVMAHETGHIAGGHLARNRQAIQQAMGPALISIGLGLIAIAAGAPDAGAAIISGSSQFAQSNFVRHTQVQESAADQAGAQFLEEAGLSGRGLVSFFNRNLRRYEFQARRMPPYMMTHPFTSDRVEALRVRVEGAPHRDAVDTPANILRFRFMQAKLIGFLNTQGQTLARYPLSDTSAPARYARAVAYYRVSELGKARAELEVLIRDDPRNPYFQELMGQILFENGRAADSIPYHQRSVDLAPNSPLLMINLARAQIAVACRDGLSQIACRANSEQAVALLQGAIAIEADNAFAWRELASARSERGEQGLADLASAEQTYAVGDYGSALNFAERARRSLTRGTPSYVRANDIATFAGEEMRSRMGRQQQGRRG